MILMVILTEKSKIKSIASRVRSSQIVGVWIPDYSYFYKQNVSTGLLKGHCIEFKYYADGIHSGITPRDNNSGPAGITKAE